MDASLYARALQSGRVSPGLQCTGLSGRIIRGTKPEDFSTLSDDPDRQVVMLVGSDGLQKLLGKTGHDMLVEIGYESDYIRRKVGEGNRFKLVVFPDGSPARLATWDNVAAIVEEIYPDVAPILRLHMSELSNMTFDKIEALAGFDFSEVDKNGKADPRYMTHERFRNSAGTLVNTRAFLYFTLHLRELYTGDGYTKTHDGRRGLMEYIVPNRPLSEFDGIEVVDIQVTLPTGTTMSTQNTAVLPLPPHYSVDQDKKAGELYAIPYQGLVTEARGWRQQHAIKLAANDRLKVALLVVDGQNTFCIPSGELFVGGRSGDGAVQDSIRLAEFVYRNLGVITSIFPTMDTHLAMQIFHEMWIVDQNGDHPQPGSIISNDDVQKGVWQVSKEVAFSMRTSWAELQRQFKDYSQKLSSGGKYPLLVWPYHAMLGGPNHALVAILEEAFFFHNIARASQTSFQIKGGNPLTENYSIFRPEVLTGPGDVPIAQKNTKFLEILLEYDVVIIAGQAKSHCVAWTIDDLLTELGTRDPQLVSKVYLLEDCTSSVVIPVFDFTDMGNDAFRRFEAAGMHVVKSTDPIETWPGISL
jgi:nicotinamidase-related amidase